MSVSVVIMRILLPFCAGYYLSYLYRVVNAVLGPVLADELALGPADLGLLTATYFIAFAAFQIPLGILLDRYGPKGVVVILLCFASLGAWVFGASDDITGLTLGRGLIGLGVSACLMASFKANVLWMPSDRLPLANSVIMISGGLGAVSATLPVQWLLGVTDWRMIFTILSVVTLVVAALILVLVPKTPKQDSNETFPQAFGGTMAVFKSRVFWSIAPLCFLSQASLMSWQALWMGPWLRDVGGYDAVLRAEILSVGTFAMVAGFMLGGWITDALRRYHIGPDMVSVAGMVLAAISMLALALDLPVSVWIVWPAVSLFGTAGIISYAALSQAFPAKVAGRVNTTINLLVFIAVFAGQYGIGLVLQLYGVDANGGYAVEGYRMAFLLILAMKAAAFLWYMKERHLLLDARMARQE